MMPWKALATAAMMIAVGGSTAWGQAVLQSRGVSSGGAWGYEQGWTYLTTNPQVQKEIEVTDEQLKKMSSIRKEFYDEQRKLYQEVYKSGKAPDALDREYYMERITELREKMNKDLGETLLPHQVERTKQIWLQNQMKSRGGQGALGSTAIRELLDISPDQYEKLVKRANELNAEVIQKYQELREEANQKLLDELTPEQRRKLEELLGEEYDPPKIDYRQMQKKKRGE